MQRYLLFTPSLILGLLGAIFLTYRPFPYTAKLGVLGLIAVALGLTLAFLGVAWLLERTLPSFRYASGLLERALSRFEISLPFAFLLAALSSISEELFFRAALLPLIGVWGQALLFGLMHPAPRRAWSYTVFTFVAGLGFGYATLLTGSLVPAILAHFAVNLHGFLELRRLQRARRKATRIFLPERLGAHTSSPSNTAVLQDATTEAQRGEQNGH